MSGGLRGVLAWKGVVPSLVVVGGVDAGGAQASLGGRAVARDALASPGEGDVARGALTSPGVVFTWEAWEVPCLGG